MVRLQTVVHPYRLRGRLSSRAIFIDARSAAVCHCRRSGERCDRLRIRGARCPLQILNTLNAKGVAGYCGAFTREDVTVADTSQA